MFDTYARTHPEFDRMVSASSVAGDNKMTMVVVGQKRTATEEMSRLTVAEEQEVEAPLSVEERLLALGLEVTSDGLFALPLSLVLPALPPALRSQPLVAAVPTAEARFFGRVRLVLNPNALGALLEQQAHDGVKQVMVYVVDHSGSMEGARIRHAVEAVKECLRLTTKIESIMFGDESVALDGKTSENRVKDEALVFGFNHEAHQVFSTAKSAAELLGKGEEMGRSLAACGSTDILAALSAAYTAATRLYANTSARVTVLLMTDGADDEARSQAKAAMASRMGEASGPQCTRLGERAAAPFLLQGLTIGEGADKSTVHSILTYLNSPEHCACVENPGDIQKAMMDLMAMNQQVVGLFKLELFGCTWVDGVEQHALLVERTVRLSLETPVELLFEVPAPQPRMLLLRVSASNPGHNGEATKMERYLSVDAPGVLLMAHAKAWSARLTSLIGQNRYGGGELVRQNEGVQARLRLLIAEPTLAEFHEELQKMLAELQKTGRLLILNEDNEDGLRALSFGAVDRQANDSSAGRMLSDASANIRVYSDQSFVDVEAVEPDARSYGRTLQRM